MKEKILAELNKKYLGLSSKVLGLVAEKLAKTVTEESQIENAVSGLDNLPVGLKEWADLLQRDGDQRVTDALKKQTPPKKEEPAPQPNDEMPAWAKALTEKFEALSTARQKETIQEKLNKKFAEKKIPAIFFKGRSVDKEEDIDALVAEVEADYTAFKQEHLNDGLDKNKDKVVGGNGKPEAIDAEIKSWSESNKPQTTTSSQK